MASILVFVSLKTSTGHSKGDWPSKGDQLKRRCLSWPIENDPNQERCRSEWSSWPVSMTCMVNPTVWVRMTIKIRLVDHQRKFRDRMVKLDSVLDSSIWRWSIFLKQLTVKIRLADHSFKYWLGPEWSSWTVTSTLMMVNHTVYVRMTIKIRLVDHRKTRVVKLVSVHDFHGQNL